VRSIPLILVIALCWLVTGPARAEIIFHDLFAGAAGSVTNSVPALDVEGKGLQLAAATSDLELDGQGHLLNATPNVGGSAGVPLIPIGPDGSMTISASINLPTNASEWIGFGLGNDNQFLAGDASQSGPWLKVKGDGSIIFYGGTGENNALTVPAAFTNSGSPVRVVLSYDAHTILANVKILTGGVTNVILADVPVTNTLPMVAASYLIFQFPASATAPSARRVSDVVVDWWPRPGPMLMLPVPTNTVTLYPVGAPTGTNDISLIQGALDFAAEHAPAQILFQAGATYHITNGSTVADIPLTLANATNVVVDGNGCKIIILNPRIGLLHLQSCSNVIVKGITVDYDPLPYTQGAVTRNLYTDPLPGGAESAIEFRPDAGYPTPTNANYLDHAPERWGVIMNTNYPGRGANNRHTIYIYSNVTNTTDAGVFKVQMPNAASVQTIEAGDFWCMVSRWNGSSVYSVANSYQITFLNLTNYAGSAANFEGNSTPLLNEIGCHVEIGPLPAGATRGRIKSSNADGGYFGNPRIGPWVENCVFTGLSDDVANAYTSPFVITNAPAYATNRFSLGSYNITAIGGSPAAVTSYEVRVGDQLDFFNALTGAIFDQAVITHVNLPYITVDHPISGIVNGTYETNTLVYNNSLNTSAVYLNNQFSNSRIHGIYCRANNMLIAHNTISGMGLSAISGFPALDLTSPNSFAPTHVIILDNVMSDCSYSYESINNLIPDEEPAFALVELHQTRYNSDYVSNTFGISGIRIMNNAFLNWRRAPLSLHNVSDVRVAGNYFGPPLTADGLVPLADDVIGDLWSCDYATIQWSQNVNATGMADDNSIYEDNNQVSLTNAFGVLAAPTLNIQVQSTNAVLSWSSISPAFVIQQNNLLTGDGWSRLDNPPYIFGASNAVVPALNAAMNQIFYRAIQR